MYISFALRRFPRLIKGSTTITGGRTTLSKYCIAGKQFHLTKIIGIIAVKPIIQLKIAPKDPSDKAGDV